MWKISWRYRWKRGSGRGETNDEQIKLLHEICKEARKLGDTQRERENEEGEGKIEEEWDDARGAGEAIESIGCKTEKRVEWCFLSYPCIVRALTNHKKGPSCHRSVHESHGEQYASNPCRLQLQTSTDTVSAPVDNRLNKLWFYKFEHY